MGSKDLSKFFRGLSLKNKNDIYILLLGQKGIGKSTFINALSNCIIFDKLKDAREESIRVLLPARLSFKDKSSSCHLVRVGTTDDVDINDSEAFSTKQIKTYVIPLDANGSSKLHIIDTPGFEGPYGFDQDKRLCEDILTYIAPFQELHAICWFLSPTDQKIASFFDYCVRIILPRIDKRSYESLVFCYTNTRDFTSGEAWLLLEKAVKDFNNSSELKIKWSNTRDDDNNIFCFENDFYRYLVGIKLGFSMDATVYASSWQHTVAEMRRLIDYILNRPKSVPLKNSFCINEGRRLITHISQPLFDVLQLIQEQTGLLESHKKELMTGSESLTHLKKKLYLPIVNLDGMSAGHPYLVCSSNKCLQFCMDWGKSRWEFSKDKCHEKCYLPRPTTHMVGGAELLECELIDKSLQLCMKCTCHYSLHLHLYYSLKWSLQKVEYTTVSQVTPTEILSVLEKLKEDMDKLINVFMQQRKDIVTNLAQFAHFMEATSITPYQCCYDDYIQSLIDRAEGVLVMPDPDAKNQLLSLQSIFREKKADYDTALVLQKQLNNDFNLLTSITPQKIMDNIIKLYNLGDIGKKVKQFMKIQKSARQSEHAQSIVNLFTTSTKGQKDTSNEAKKENKKYKDNKKESSSSDSDSGTSAVASKFGHTKVNTKVNTKVDKKKQNTEANERKSGKPAEENTKKSEQWKNNKDLKKKWGNEKVWKPATASTSTAMPNKGGVNSKPYKNKYPRVPPPSYDSVISQEISSPSQLGQRSPRSNQIHPNLSQTTLSGPDVQNQRHPPPSQTIEVKVFNTPLSSQAEASPFHSPAPHSGFSHLQNQPSHPTNFHQDFAPFPPPYEHYSPHQSHVQHGPHNRPFFHSPTYPIHGPGYHGPQPHNSGHFGPGVHHPSHGPHHGAPYQGGPLHHGPPGAPRRGHPNPANCSAKGKNFDKKEHTKFKRDHIRKGKKEIVKKAKSDSSSSSSSSDSD